MRQAVPRPPVQMASAPAVFGDTVREWEELRNGGEHGVWATSAMGYSPVLCLSARAAGQGWASCELYLVLKRVGPSVTMTL